MVALALRMSSEMVCSDTGVKSENDGLCNFSCGNDGQHVVVVLKPLL